nr:DUF4279 domain-containing protein [Pyrinomonadaceae bacterium]
MAKTTKNRSDEIGGEVDKSCVSLRFFGENLSPEEITELLNCSPTNFYVKGQIISNEVSKKGAWLLKTEKNEKPLEKQIDELLGRLTKNLDVWKLLTTKFKADLFCGLWLYCQNRGTSLSPEILKHISDRGLKIDFDIYYLSQM